jgi:hypothetical protein
MSNLVVEKNTKKIGMTFIPHRYIRNFDDFNLDNFESSEFEKTFVFVVSLKGDGNLYTLIITY